MKVASQILKNNSLDRFSFIIGISLFVVIAIVLSLIFIFDRIMFLKVMGVITASIVGGRITAIVVGIELKLYNIVICIVLFLVNVTFLLILYPFITHFHENVIERKFLKNILNLSYEKAKKEKNKWSKIGTFSVPVFIWLPFPLTGAIAGSFLGLFLGMKKDILLITVIVSMLVGILSWTFGFEYFVNIIGPTGKIVTYVIIALLLIFTFIDRLLNGKKNFKQN
ncbi:MAG: small multi-drug export protein [Candidatus Marinimicrobia bacterium]|nr:small multi-drug export protein [Candidatus Neomarinimicrobiota bacterium]